MVSSSDALRARPKSPESQRLARPKHPRVRTETALTDLQPTSTASNDSWPTSDEDDMYILL